MTWRILWACADHSLQFAVTMFIWYINLPKTTLVMPRYQLLFSRMDPLQYITEYSASLCRASQPNCDATFTALIIQELQSL
ncbi:hypothetical protein BDW66DRAFT_144469, partial [Aspergillus desertorum]